MTRLRAEELRGLGRALAYYDRLLTARTGWTLRQIACRAAGVSEDDFLERAPQTTAAAVSFTSGAGVIPGFAASVRDVVAYLGPAAFVPEAADVTGVAEAVSRGATLLFLADDLSFVALNLRTRFLADNAECTGRGFTAALEGLAGGDLDGRPVLVIGAGRVGGAAARRLHKLGARVGICDREPTRARRLAEEVSGVVEPELDGALARYALLLEATPSADVIDVRHLRPETVVAAAGVPLGVTAAARERLGSRWIHDPLPIGVAAMTVAAVVGGPGRPT